MVLIDFLEKHLLGVLVGDVLDHDCILCVFQIQDFVELEFKSILVWLLMLGVICSVGLFESLVVVSGGLPASLCVRFVSNMVLIYLESFFKEMRVIFIVRLWTGG